MKTIYRADDGTEFESQADCVAHEAANQQSVNIARFRSSLTELAKESLPEGQTKLSVPAVVEAIVNNPERVYNLIGALLLPGSPPEVVDPRAQVAQTTLSDPPILDPNRPPADVPGVPGVPGGSPPPPPV